LKILHVVRQFYPMIGGIENYVLKLSAEQLKNNEVTVLTLNRSFVDGSVLPEKETINGINIIRIPYIGSKRYPIALSSLKYLKDYDVIHVHCVDFFIDYLAITKLLHKKKIILTTHGGFFHTKKFSLLKILFFNCITRFTIKGCDKVIACGDNDFNIFSKISSKVVKIDNGVNTKPYINNEKLVKIGTIVYVGRIDIHKRIDNIIRVVKAIHDKGFLANLHIIGPDWNKLRPELEKLASQLNINNSVVFKGAVSDQELINEYKEAQIFVSASEYEGFGLSAIEALSSGTLCVVHKNNSFLKLFEDTKFAILSDFSNTEETANKIIEILNLPFDKYNSLSKQAREYANQYSWEYVEQKITKFYN
jgi:alpha-1,3-mannosyltransferase